MYEYSDLQEGHTRILEYVPSDSNEGELTFQVKEIDLSGSYPPYIALSYAWGDERSLTHEILFDGKPVKVTSRLHSMLRRIRDLLSDDDKQSWNHIWVDAISISQHHTAEKNHQVSMMHAIFAKATEVIVCLGETDFDHELKEWFSEDNEFMKYRASIIKNAFGYSSNADMLDKAYQYREVFDFGKHVPEVMSVLEDAKDDAKYINRILKDPWFSRTWCIQEFVLGESVRFLLGHTVIESTAFQDKILGSNLREDYVYKPTSDIVVVYGDSESQLSLDRFGWLSARRMVMKNDPTLRMSLSVACSSVCTFDSTRDLDFIYGLNALIDYADEPLQIDYDRSPEDLGVDISQRFIRSGRSEAALYMSVGVEGSLQSLPSWRTRLRKSIQLRNIDNLMGADIALFFCAGGDGNDTTLQDCKIKEHKYCRTIPGVVLDTITGVSEVYPYVSCRTKWSPYICMVQYDTDRGALLSNHACYVFINRILSVLKTVPGHEDMQFSSPLIWEQFVEYHRLLSDEEWSWIGKTFATLIENDSFVFEDAEWLHDQTLSWEQVAKHMEERLDYVMAEALDGRSRDVADNPKTWRKPIEGTFPPGTAINFVNMVGRCFCKTQGDRIGIVKETTQPGDVLMLFKGVRHPFIMRPWKENTFKIVGSANIHGMMFGEAIPEQWDEVHIV